MSSSTYRCHCTDCLVANPDGRPVTRHIYYAHKANKYLRQTPRGLDDQLPVLGERKASHSAIRALDSIGAELRSLASNFVEPDSLRFRVPPQSEGDSEPSATVDGFNTGHLALLGGDPRNSRLLDLECWIYDALHRVQAVQQLDDAVVQVRTLLQSHLEDQLARVEQIKRRHWESQVSQALPVPLHIRSKYHRVEPRENRAWQDLSPTLIATQLLVAILHFFGHLSHAMSNLVLLFQPVILMSWARPGNRNDEEILSRFPKDVRAVVNQLKLEPITRDYVCCSRCFTLYPVQGDDDANGPTHCIARSAPDAAPCGTALYRTVTVQGRSRVYPTRRYLHHDFHHWLANFLQRPGMEQLLERRADVSGTDTVDDIWGGSLLREFKDKDGVPFFQVRDGKAEGRYAFSLCVDGYGPFGASSGKAVSAVGIFLVFLNLPPGIRYLYENMYLAGVVPGPNAPALDDLNHVLVPLIDDFCSAYDPGVYISRTPAHPGGRLTRSVILPIVCDMKAAKQIMGLSAHNSTYFCSYCLLTIRNINNLDCAAWKPRNSSDWRLHAERYRDADLATRARLFEEHGIRYTELFRLPYFDPVQALSTETMHLFYLRVFQTHTRILWGMTTKVSSGDSGLDGTRTGKRRRTNVPVSANDLEKGLWSARYDSKKLMEKYLVPNKLVQAVCNRLDIRLDPSVPRQKFRPTALAALLEYRRNPNNHWPEDMPAQNPRDKGKTGDVTQAELDAAQQVYQSLGNLNTLRLKALVALAIQRVGKPASKFSKKTKAAIITRLEAQRLVDGFIRDAQAEAQPTQILGGVLMKEVHADMQKTAHHSSLPSVASNIGAPGAGTISADHSRTFFMRNLVTTVPRLFGSASHPKRPETVNFMHLVTAVAAAEARHSSPALTDLYARHAYAYLGGIRRLYPRVTLTPSHHTMLHVPRSLRSMGPTKAHRAFPFERFIFKLKQIPTNKKAADAAVTMFRNMARDQNLRALIADAMTKMTELPDIVRQLAALFVKTTRADSRGMLRGDISSVSSAEGVVTDENDVDDVIGDILAEPLGVLTDTASQAADDAQDVMRMPDELVIALRRRFPGVRLSSSRHALRTHRLDAGGETYLSRPKTYTDAQVAFIREGSGPYNWTPGEIQEFIVPLGPQNTPLYSSAVAMIREYCALSATQAQHDCWRNFGPCAGRVYLLDTAPAHAVFAVDMISPLTIARNVCESKIRAPHALFIPKDQNGVILSDAIGKDAFLESAEKVSVCD